MSHLFSPLAVGAIEVPNRVVVAPMCQYSAADGCATDWHLQHLMQLAISRAGMVVLEATAVERHGRISHGCLGLYSDANEAALARVLDPARRVAAPGTRFAIQIGHAGRKASSQRPWEGGKPLTPAEDAWPTVAPSAVPFNPDGPPPQALDAKGMERITAAFVQAAERAVRLGFDAIELHGAHGYLLHSFVSPLSNFRKDNYGGSLENRMRFPLEVARAVRVAVPRSIALGARITGTDWADGGLGAEDAVAFAAALKGAGLDYICVSGGGAVAERQDRIGARLPGALCRQGEGCDRHRHARRRSDRHARAGGGHRGLGAGRLRGARPRLPRRRPLGVARRRAPRRPRLDAFAVRACVAHAVARRRDGSARVGRNSPRLDRGRIAPVWYRPQSAQKWRNTLALLRPTCQSPRG